MPFLSVVVPVYKVERYLEACIKSILDQTYTDLEIILVDDGGKDACPLICDRYAKQDQRIKVIHKENGGLVSARKAGLSEATGNYIAFVDGDDSIEKDMYKVMCKSAEENNADIVVEGFQFIHPDKVEVWQDRVPRGNYDKAKLREMIYPVMMCHDKKLTRDVAPAIWNKIFRRRIIAPILMQMDERIKDGEDAAVTYPCFLMADRITFLTDKHHYRYRINPVSMSRSFDPLWYESASAYAVWIENMVGNESEIPMENIQLEKLMMLYRYLNREYVFCQNNEQTSYKKRMKKIVEETPIGRNLEQLDFSKIKMPILEKMQCKALKHKWYGVCQVICCLGDGYRRVRNR